MKHVLGTLKTGTVVKVGHRWGVIAKHGGTLDSRRWIAVDFWEGGREKVDAITLVYTNRGRGGRDAASTHPTKNQTKEAA